MSRQAIVVGIAAVLLQVAGASAQSSNVEFTVSGSSTVRNWTCSAQGVIAVTPGTSAIPAPGFASGVQAATVTVPLKAFKCPNDEMTQHLNEAMKAAEFPEVVYRLEKYAVTGGQAQSQVEGEGSYTATRKYQLDLKEYLDKADVAADAEAAKPRSEEEARELEQAEREGKSHSRGER